MTTPQRPVRVLELRSVRGTGGGPEKTILLGAAATDPSRARVTVCYMRDARDPAFMIDTRARSLGIDYVELLERHSFDPSIAGALERLVVERQIDVVHAHEYKSNALALWARRRTGVGLISTAHGWTGHSARERLLYYPADRWLLTRFPLVLAVSGELRARLLEAGARPERVRVLLNGIDPGVHVRDREREPAARDRFGVAGDGPVIGSVGRLEPQKRFDLLIEACAAARGQWPALMLLIAGEGSERGALERLIASRGFGSWCRLLGHLPDVSEFHHAIDLFVQSSAYEGTPNVVLEAMALETAVVATDVGGTAEICRPGRDGLIVAPGDSASLSRAIALALHDAGARQGRVASARERIERDLSFAARVKVLEDLYEELGCASS